MTRRLNLTRRFAQWLRPGWRGSLARMVDGVAYVSPAGVQPAVTPPRLPASPQSAAATDPDHPPTEEHR